MPTELELRARELLAAEQESAGFPYTAWRIREQIDLTDDEAIAIRAIAAALPAQQPGAQAVAPEVAVAWQRRIRGDSGKWLAWSEWEDLYGEGKVQKVGRFDCEYRPLYTHPQPTEGTTPVVTIPEPSEEDAKVAECDRVRHLKAISAYGSAGVDERYDMAMRAALTTYTARLRDRIGGGR
jgi:hypothetical protein